MNDHTPQVYHEAIFVGVTMLPLWMLVQRSTAFMRIGGVHKDKLDVLLAGMLYHLIAEDTGLNEFYAKNGAAVKKLLTNTTEGAYDGSVIGNIDWLCSDFPNRDCPKVLNW